MKLYYAPGACSLAPHILAREAGLDLELAKVEFGPHKMAEGRDYTQVNPKDVVPALELDDQQVLTENAVVLRYLADLVPEAGLGAPKSGMARWRFLETLNFIATELHKGFGPLWNRHTPPEVRDWTVRMLGKKFGHLERSLGDKPYLTGDRFTLVDAYAFVVLSWTKQHQIDLAPWPGLVAYLQRIGDRPAVRQALAEEGLV